MFKIQISERKDLVCFGHSELAIGICLGFGIWTLEFPRRCNLATVKRDGEKRGGEKDWVVWGDLQPHPSGSPQGSGRDWRGL